MHACHLQLEQLRQQLAQWEAGSKHLRSLISSGLQALDHALPTGGLRPGSLIEWLAEGPGHGVGALALVCARELCRQGGALVVVDPRRQFYPPALAGWGIDLGRLVLLRPTSKQQTEWALVQALRSPAVAAVWTVLDKVDPHAFRRLQLAAQAGGAVGLLVRPARRQRDPTWADVQLMVQPRPGYEPRRLRVSVVRARGGKTKGPLEVILDEQCGQLREVTLNHDAHPLLLVPQLARSAPAERAARA